MIWIIRLFLLVMGLTYFAIGVWAIFDSMFDFLPSFLEAVGLSITSEIGYSEIAGLYGGLNLCIGLMCLVGLAKEDIGIFSIKFLIQNRVIYQTLKPIIPIWVIEKKIFFTDS